uniref:Transmembrane protein n=1 Tax=Anopheles epiroticus TaxID=199890 RepID=A0A182PBX4_9DIPT
MTTTRRKALDGGPEGLHYKSTVLLGERGKRKDHEQPDNAVQNSSIYVFLSVLVVLLLAAGVDIAKHLTGSDRNGGREDAKRRLSLQNYQALIREKQKQFRMMKQHYSQPSISIQRSMDESVPGAPSAGAFARMEEAPSPVGKSIPTPRLQRRQSVPTLMRTQLVPLGGGVGGAAFSTVQHVPPPFGRRTSIDSFWDVDHTIKGGGNGPTSSNGSPPEVRRRVRMLHRH